MQTYHLLAQLRIEKPTQKSKFLKILQDHQIIDCSKTQIDLAWEHCQTKEYQQVIQDLLSKRVRSISLKPKVQQKLRTLVQTFDKIDELRLINGIYKQKVYRKICYDKEILKQIQELKLDAERKLKDFINETAQDKNFTQVFQQKLIDFQEERNKLNEQQGKEGSQRAKDRLLNRQKMKSARLNESIQFILKYDDNKDRAQTICNKLLDNQIPYYKSQLSEKQQTRIQNIMNTKFLF
ncbi:unnamed protein product [Paramecium pentaurelia]|uniref:Uncharacterized protein n=1 Tax=Paramecium pentaurelia TaxID=43138 RepID=A0A8S1WEQ9_9CILI|nr:unnamed protein product [Paramecium pentaurelia]